jgi:hypothetical protein
MFVQRATAILEADILSLPYPADENLGLSANERIIAENIVDYRWDFVRPGSDSALMQRVSGDALALFDKVLITQVHRVYDCNSLRPLEGYAWAGAICKAYAFGEGEVDWSGAEGLRLSVEDRD